MSAHYSKFLLNTYAMMPYFQAQVPDGYQLDRVLRKGRAFRRLPPHLRQLASLAKRWAMRKAPQHPAGILDIEHWYDAAGNELDPATGQRLTDAEIDRQWQDDPSLVGFTPADIPVPAGGFPDPDAWEEPADAAAGPAHVPTDAQLRLDIESRGAKATAAAYGIPLDRLPKVAVSSGEDRFARRSKAALASAYLRRNPSERRLLVEALKGADIYDDLGGRAKDVFDRAEAAGD